MYDARARVLARERHALDRDPDQCPAYRVAAVVGGRHGDGLAGIKAQARLHLHRRVFFSPHISRLEHYAPKLGLYG